MRRLVIAIDGPAGAGKSTVARRVAEMLGYVYVDSGAMYRAVALKALRQGVDLDGAEPMANLAKATRVEVPAMGEGQAVLLDGEDVGKAIRSADVAEAASRAAVLPGVRRVLVSEQQRIGQNGGVVMEGRDIGTVVFPKADLKIFLTATVEERARRRRMEFERKGMVVNSAQMTQEVMERDRRDVTREVSPLLRAADAVVVDSSAIEAEEAARLITMLARERENQAAEPAQRV